MRARPTRRCAVEQRGLRSWCRMLSLYESQYLACKVVNHSRIKHAGKPQLSAYEPVHVSSAQSACSNVATAAQVELQDVFAGKKGVLFGVPGAFTPGCSKTHLPGYINDYQKLRDAGAEVVVCTAGNPRLGAFSPRFSSLRSAQATARSCVTLACKVAGPSIHMMCCAIHVACFISTDTCGILLRPAHKCAACCMQASI